MPQICCWTLHFVRGLEHTADSCGTWDRDDHALFSQRQHFRGPTTVAETECQGIRNVPEASTTSGDQASHWSDQKLEGCTCRTEQVCVTGPYMHQRFYDEWAVQDGTGMFTRRCLHRFFHLEPDWNASGFRKKKKTTEH